MYVSLESQVNIIKFHNIKNSITFIYGNFIVLCVWDCVCSLCSPLFRITWCVTAVKRCNRVERTRRTMITEKRNTSAILRNNTIKNNCRISISGGQIFSDFGSHDENDLTQLTGEPNVIRKWKLQNLSSFCILIFEFSHLHPIVACVRVYRSRTRSIRDFRDRFENIVTWREHPLRCDGSLAANHSSWRESECAWLCLDYTQMNVRPEFP